MNPMLPFNTGGSAPRSQLLLMIILLILIDSLPALRSLPTWTLSVCFFPVLFPIADLCLPRRLVTS